MQRNNIQFYLGLPTCIAHWLLQWTPKIFLMTGDVETNPGSQLTSHSCLLYFTSVQNNCGFCYYAMNYFTKNIHIFGFWLRTVCVCACVQACMDSFVLSTRDHVLYSSLASRTVSLETLFGTKLLAVVASFPDSSHAQMQWKAGWGLGMRLPSAEAFCYLVKKPFALWKI